MTEFKIDRIVPQYSCAGEFYFHVYKAGRGLFGRKKWEWLQRFKTYDEALEFVDQYIDFPVFVLKVDRVLS